MATNISPIPRRGPSRPHPAIWAGVLLLAGCGAGFDDLSNTVSTAVQPDPDLSDPAEMVLAEGTVKGAGSYSGSGTATLEKTAGGAIRLRFSDDFSVSSVPGPVVVLSDRDRIGSRLATDDVRLGAIDKAAGAQSFSVPASAVGLRWVWIWCEPFGVDVAFAILEYRS